MCNRDSCTAQDSLCFPNSTLSLVCVSVIQGIFTSYEHVCCRCSLSGAFKYWNTRSSVTGQQNRYCHEKHNTSCLTQTHVLQYFFPGNICLMQRETLSFQPPRKVGGSSGGHISLHNIIYHTWMLGNEVSDIIHPMSVGDPHPVLQCAMLGHIVKSVLR